MYSLIRPLLFKLDTERAHRLSLSTLDYLPQFCFKKVVSAKPIEALGLKFPHAIGLAAGLDKNGEHLEALAKLGFAFIEIGTVTPKAQLGNAKPRLFRLPKSEAIINRMGFNNVGVDGLISNLSKTSYQGILGINIGKSKDTPLDKAVDDYLFCLRKVYPYAHYVTINISSPNTPDLRLLQQADYLSSLLEKLAEERLYLADKFKKNLPLLIKISPDEDDETLKQIAETILKAKIDGIIATNTTCSRQNVEDLAKQETGGLSGKPLAKRATEVLKILKAQVGNELTLIGVGGIDNVDVAKEKLEAGASLLQVYTGLIYQGPGLISRLVKGLDGSSIKT